MPFRLRCLCNRILTIPENLAGHKGRCPGCQKKFLIPQLPAYLKPTERRNPFEPDHPMPPIPVLAIPGPTATPTGPGQYESADGVSFEEVTELPLEKPASMGGPPEDHDLVATPEPFPVPAGVAASPGAAPANPPASPAPPSSRPGVRPSQGPVPAIPKSPSPRPSGRALPAVPAAPPPPPPTGRWRKKVPVWILIVGAVAFAGMGALVMWLLR